MSKKRDEMAESYVMSVYGNYQITGALSCERDFKAGWDAALVNDERVLALVEALEFYARRENLELDTSEFTFNFDPSYPNWRIAPPFLLSAEQGQRAMNTLTKYRKGIKK